MVAVVATGVFNAGRPPLSKGGKLRTFVSTANPIPLHLLKKFHIFKAVGMMIRRQVLWIILSFVHLQALLLTLNEWKTSRILPEISDMQWDQLELLREKLTDWNEKVNLISRKDIDRLVPPI